MTSLFEQYFNELDEFVDKYIPLGDENFICHKGFPDGLKKCIRCNQAIRIRQIINDIKSELEG